MHLNNKLKYYTVFVCFLFSCSASKKLYSKYCMDVSGPDNTVLWFNDDYSFKGRSHSDIAGTFYAAGKWTKSNDTVFLSLIIPSIVDSVISSSGNNTDGKTIIKIIDIEKKRPLGGVEISTNGKNYTTSEKGEAFIEAFDSKFLYFDYMGMKDSIEAALVKNKSATVNLDFRKLQSFQVSSRWVINGKRLVPLDKGYSVFKRCK